MTKGGAHKAKPEVSQKTSREVEKVNNQSDEESEELPSLENYSQSSDEMVGISDIPIFRISKMENETEIKPTGSAYILIDMCVNEAPQIKIKTRVCVDTGADMTICSHTFIIKTIFGGIQITLESYGL